MMSFEEFKSQITRSVGKSTKKFKVTGSIGVYDIYKKIRKNKWCGIGKPITEKEFYAIIRRVNTLLAENIANGIDVIFPSRMGKLEIRKYQCGASFVDNKLRIKYPVDWSETLKMWYENEELKKQKILKRHEIPYMFTVKYIKSTATYNNKVFYSFVVNRFIKKALSKNIKQGKIETLW